MKILLSELQNAAAHKPPGYLEDVIRSGKVIGPLLDIPDDVYWQLANRYRASLLQQGISLVTALARWAKEGFPVVDDATLFDRSAHCALCPAWDALAGRCMECGCYSLKHWLATERCPLGNWPAS